jgi:hypothetical protein
MTDATRWQQGCAPGLQRRRTAASAHGQLRVGTCDASERAQRVHLAEAAASRAAQQLGRCSCWGQLSVHKELCAVETASR